MKSKRKILVLAGLTALLPLINGCETPQPGQQIPAHNIYKTPQQIEQERLENAANGRRLLGMVLGGMGMQTGNAFGAIAGNAMIDSANIAQQGAQQQPQVQVYVQPGQQVFSPQYPAQQREVLKRRVYAIAHLDHGPDTNGNNFLDEEEIVGVINPGSHISLSSVNAKKYPVFHFATMVEGHAGKKLHAHIYHTDSQGVRRELEHDVFELNGGKNMFCSCLPLEKVVRESAYGDITVEFRLGEDEKTIWDSYSIWLNR